MRRALRLALAIAVVAPLPPAAASQCYGRPGKGRLEGGVQLPLEGDNFSAYSTVAAGAGRTYLHATSAAIVVDAYARLNAGSPANRYVYGETGLASGGLFKPHRTHQNGLSIDFFVPVRDARDVSVALPTQGKARFGYDIEFDRNARYQQLRIDFPALAEHLYQLDAAARAHGARIANVILAREFLAMLWASPRGPWVKKNIPFMVAKPWVRHDEHYHVDFSLPCQPGVPKGAAMDHWPAKRDLQALANQGLHVPAQHLIFRRRASGVINVAGPSPETKL
ncbi:penicillin-insensitive murein endopeptidase [Massilia sp. TSP1-1-2]|uniref:penicillin-insensitive murein endopeptidase n=1 Tax=unclassified Massilia TaxID=2609279 RepID=UPI003CEA6C9A